MKLAASDIAWPYESDEQIYRHLAELGITGLEIAPTRIFPQDPYGDLQAAQSFARRLYAQYHLQVVSMQSIWYGRRENIFNGDGDFAALLTYTKKAIDFAVAIGCPNLVFGCPANRRRVGREEKIGMAFLQEVGEYAKRSGVVFAIEANPVIYNTDYLNGTDEAIAVAAGIDSAGIGVNLDIGAMLENGEGIAAIESGKKLIHHVHLSEPYLKEIKPHALHEQIKNWLGKNKYDNYISLEMGRQDDLAGFMASLQYMKEVFGNAL